MVSGDKQRMFHYAVTKVLSANAPQTDPIAEPPLTPVDSSKGKRPASRSRRSSGVGGVAEALLFTNVIPFREFTPHGCTASPHLLARLCHHSLSVHAPHRDMAIAWLMYSAFDKNFCHGHVAFSLCRSDVQSETAGSRCWSVIIIISIITIMVIIAIIVIIISLIAVASTSPSSSSTTKQH